MQLSPEIKTQLLMISKDVRDFIAELLAENERLAEENSTMRARLGKNSTNSSVPPSKNGFAKPKSLRTPSGKKPGGQPGHEGSTLIVSEAPDVIVEHKVCICDHCSANIPSDATPIRHIPRQVVDIEIRRVITEHRADVYICPDCGQETTAAFPEQVKHYLQYGPFFNALILYLNQGNFVPFDRLAKFRETHQKRGNEATEAIGILTFFSGIAVHDFWKPYFGYLNCDHAMCNAHLLRELNGIEENDKQLWPKQMKEVLLDAKKLLETNISAPHPDEVSALEARYDEVLFLGDSENPIKQAVNTGPKKRGRVAKSKACNLLERMSRYRENILLFLHRPEVPFDNNLAERDIRMSKTQQKVSGGFRSKDGCDAFDVHRSYIATAIKHGISVFDAIMALTSGKPLFTYSL